MSLQLKQFSPEESHSLGYKDVPEVEEELSETDNSTEHDMDEDGFYISIRETKTSIGASRLRWRKRSVLLLSIALTSILLRNVMVQRRSRTSIQQEVLLSSISKQQQQKVQHEQQPKVRISPVRKSRSVSPHGILIETEIHILAHSTNPDHDSTIDPLSNTRLVVCSGESNMQDWSIDETFSPMLEKAFVTPPAPMSQRHGNDSSNASTSDRVVIVKTSARGRSIRDWYYHYVFPNATDYRIAGEIYDETWRHIQDVLQTESRITSVVFVWMQGESDAEDGLSTVYEQSLLGLMDQLYKDLKEHLPQIVSPILPTVLGRINDYHNGQVDWDQIREIQAKLAFGPSASSSSSSSLGTAAAAAAVADGEYTQEKLIWRRVINTDDCNDPGNNRSMTLNGYRVMGYRLALAAADLLTRQDEDK